MAFPKKLLIAARVEHYRHKGRFYAYTPYAREIDVWAELFEHVTIAGTLRECAPPGDCSPFRRKNVHVVAVAEAGGDGAAAKLSQLFALPRIVWQLARCMRNADAVHARCPCDLGMLATLLAPLFTRHVIAKYATQWLPYFGEPLAWRLQRAILRSTWWRGPVTVYGKWPNQPAKIIPFFTSMLTEEQIAQSRIAAAIPRDPDAFRVLFVGRLSKSKNVDVLLQAVSQLNVDRRKLQCIIVGEGLQKASLQKQVAELGIKDLVQFTGGLGFEEVLHYYESAHVLVLASDIEGWPKAIAEAMAFGVVCIGTAKGMMPQMLGEGRGVLVPARDVAALQKALQFIAGHPQEAAVMTQRAAAWAQEFSLDGLKAALRDVLCQHWTIKAERWPEARQVFLK